MNKKILKLAIPNILSNISIPMLSAVDTAIVGHMEKVAYIGAIAVGSMIFNVLYLGLGFLRMGTTGLTAQAYGRDDKEGMMYILSRAVLIAFASGMLMIFLQEPIIKLTFMLVDTPIEVRRYAREYFYIRIYAAPITLTLFAAQGFFLGAQNARYPLYIALFINGLNIVLDFVFVYVAGMRSDGVALGTVFAQYAGFILMLHLLTNKYGRHMEDYVWQEVFNLTEFTKYFRVNFNIFLRTMSLIFVLTFFMAQSTELGEGILAVNAVLMQLWMLIAYGVDGFAFAAESLVGKYLGRKDPVSLKKVVGLNLIWGLGLGVLFTLVYLFFFDFLVSLLTDKSVLLELAREYYWWIVASPVINSICFIWDGVYIGATSTRAIRNSMIFSAFIVFLPIYYYAFPELKNHALWLSLLGFMTARGLTLSLAYKWSVLNKLKN